MLIEQKGRKPQLSPQTKKTFGKVQRGGKRAEVLQAGSKLSRHRDKVI